MCNEVEVIRIYMSSSGLLFVIKIKLVFTCITVGKQASSSVCSTLLVSLFTSLEVIELNTDAALVP